MTVIRKWTFSRGIRGTLASPQFVIRQEYPLFRQVACRSMWIINYMWLRGTEEFFPCPIPAASHFASSKYLFYY